MSAASDPLFDGARLVITSGAGGVGKTTTAAALALESARSGRRTAVLTIDPARRLANALGLEAFHDHAQRVEGAGPLWAMMLDMRTTADAMVRRFSPDEAAARRILDNPYYGAFSTSLAGTQEYMAVEQVHALVRSGDYDLVVLDTPPAVHAIDFLTAPDRILGALDNRAVNWLYKPRDAGEHGQPQGYGARLLGRGRQVVLKSLDRFTGGPFFEDLASFLQAFSALFEAFRQSSRAVQALLRADSTRFLVVTAPYPGTVREAIGFRAELVTRGFPFAGFVCNRVHDARPAASLDALAAALGPHAPARLAEALATALADHNRMAARDADGLAALRQADARPVRVVPLMPEDVHDLEGLSRVGRALMQNFSSADTF